MKLEPGKCSYDLPSIGKLLSVVIDDKGDVFVLSPIELRDLVMMRRQAHDPAKEDTRGLPRYYALAPTLDRLEIFPPPVTAYNCRIKFYPPSQEI